MDVDTHTISTIRLTSRDIDRNLNVWDCRPMNHERAIMPFGGMRMVIKGAEAYGRVDPMWLRYSKI